MPASKIESRLSHYIDSERKGFEDDTENCNKNTYL